jgi:hypothetical protein
MIRAGFDLLRTCGLPAGSHGTFFIRTRKSMRKVVCKRVTPNKQLQRTVIRHRVRSASAAISLCTCAALDKVIVRPHESPTTAEPALLSCMHPSRLTRQD